MTSSSALLCDFRNRKRLAPITQRAAVAQSHSVAESDSIPSKGASLCGNREGPAALRALAALILELCPSSKALAPLLLSH